MDFDGNRRQLAAAMEASAELLARLGGPHGLTAALLRRQLDGMAASRKAPRDAAIVALRGEWFSHLSEAAAAAAIAAELRRYAAAAWKRSDRALEAAPLAYLGTAKELLFNILRLSEGKPPGAEAVRKILASARAGKIPALEFTSQLRLDSSRDPRSAPMSFEDPILAAALRDLPEVKAAQARAIDAEIAERRRRLAAIEKSDGEARKAYPKEEAKRSAAVERLRQAERDLATAQRELSAVNAAIAADRNARESERRLNELALLAGDWSAIEQFRLDALDEQERARKHIITRSSFKRNEITGRIEHTAQSNIASVNRRVLAILASIREAPDLRLLADVRELPARLAAIKAGWPPVEDLPDGPLAPAK
jgi:hypothetical protein